MLSDALFYRNPTTTVILSEPESRKFDRIFQRTYTRNSGDEMCSCGAGG